MSRSTNPGDANAIGRLDGDLHMHTTEEGYWWEHTERTRDGRSPKV